MRPGRLRHSVPDPAAGLGDAARDQVPGRPSPPRPNRYTGAMPPEVLRPQGPSGSSSGAASLEGRLLQDRLRLFGGIGFVIAAVFYGVGQVLARLGRENPPDARRARGGRSRSWCCMGGTWLYCRRVPRSERTLRALDVLLLLALGVLVLFTPFGLDPGARAARDGHAPRRQPDPLHAVDLHPQLGPADARRERRRRPPAGRLLAGHRDRAPVGLEGDVASGRDHRRHRGLGGDLRAAARGAARAPARPVHARGEARRGRDGGRLPGPPRDAAAADRGQAAQARADGRGEPAALRARGAAHGRAQPPEHRHGLRLRPHAGRRLLLRDGVPGRASASTSSWRADGPQPPGARRAHPPPGARRARRGPRRRPRPPRHQAGQRHPVRAGRALGRREGRGLRPRQGPRGRGRR